MGSIRGCWFSHPLEVVMLYLLYIWGGVPWIPEYLTTIEV